MKITLFVLTFFVFRISTAQELSVSVSSGYNHKVAGGTFATYQQNYLVGAFFPYSVEYSTYSLGKGINTNLGIHYTTKRNFGIQIEGSYLHGLSTTNVSTYSNNNYFRKEIYSRFYRVISQFYFDHEINKVNIQFHAGIIINWGTFSLEEENYSSSSSYFKYKNVFSGGVSAGIITGITSNFKINDKLSFFIDLNLINSSHSPLKRKTTEMFHGESNVLETFPIAYKEIEYSNSYEPVYPLNTNEIAKGLRFKTPNSSIGLQIGVNFQLWKKAEKETLEL